MGTWPRGFENSPKPMNTEQIPKFKDKLIASEVIEDLDMSEINTLENAINMANYGSMNEIPNDIKSISLS